MGFMARPSTGVHPSEQKSQYRCFDRSGSIRVCATDGEPTENHVPTRARKRREVCQHPAGSPSDRAGPPGRDKPLACRTSHELSPSNSVNRRY